MNNNQKRERDDDDDDDDFKLPQDVLEMVSQKKNGTVAKKHRILKEEIVEQDIVDSMIDVTDRSDLRDVLGIKDGLEIEVKWFLEFEDNDNGDVDGYQWVCATVSNTNIDKTHKFIDEDDNDDFTHTPIVILKYEEETKEVCFIGDHLLYDIEDDSVVPWRVVGDEYDVDDDAEDNIEDIHFIFSDVKELELEVNKLIPKIFINVLTKYKSQYESLPFIVRRQWDSFIVIMKDKLVEKIINYFKANQKTPGAVTTLKQNDIDDIFEECFSEMDKIE